MLKNVSEVESISVRNLNMASAYYACVFDAEAVAAPASTAEERVIRIGSQLYRLAHDAAAAGELHAAIVRDVDVAIARIATKGGQILSPAAQTDCGREGRVRDPFGHEWLVKNA